MSFAERGSGAPDPSGNGVRARLLRALGEWRAGQAAAAESAASGTGLTARAIAVRAALIGALVAGGAGSYSVWGRTGPEEPALGTVRKTAHPATVVSTTPRAPTPRALATASRPNDLAERFLGFIVAGEEAPADTIRYRVCKDLASCLLGLAVPTPGIVYASVPGAPLALAPAPIFRAALVPAGRNYLLGLPLLALLWLPRSHGEHITPGPPVQPVPPGPPTPGPPQPPPPPPTTVPEPMTLMLVGSGLAGVAAARRRARRGE